MTEFTENQMAITISLKLRLSAWNTVLRVVNASPKTISYQIVGRQWWRLSPNAGVFPSPR
ncbi:hypothetical protein [Mesorhizobium tianshanense]|uniref:hypothetical protein n=2 Tax=Mesorhizobium tianshanense TaxID=39844 RepID=UPI0024E13CE5|nr:hypothetical protein [Mesorhizobium tianshanense]